MESTSAENEPLAHDGVRELERRLLAALALELPYEERLLRDAGTPAAVLILFGFARGAAEPSVLVIRRADRDGSPHSGQMAFPGGVCEPDELVAPESAAGIVAAAVRETQEEVGIQRGRIRVLGRLPALATVTGFLVHPVVGVLEGAIEDSPLAPSPAEIAEALWVPLSLLAGPATYRREYRQVGPVRYPIHVYEVSGHRIWGATGAMIKNLLDRLAAVCGVA